MHLLSSECWGGRREDGDVVGTTECQHTCSTCQAPHPACNRKVSLLSPDVLESSVEEQTLLEPSTSLLEQNLPSCEMTQMLAWTQKSAEEETRKLECQQPSLCRLIRASLSSLRVPDMTQAETGAITQPWYPVKSQHCL